MCLPSRAYTRQCPVIEWRGFSFSFVSHLAGSISADKREACLAIRLIQWSAETISSRLPYHSFRFYLYIVEAILPRQRSLPSRSLSLSRIQIESNTRASSLHFLSFHRCYNTHLQFPGHNHAHEHCYADQRRQIPHERRQRRRRSQPIDQITFSS